MDVIESIFWTGFTMACTVEIVVTCVYATMFMGSKLTQYSYAGNPQKQSDAKVEVAMGIVALVFAFILSTSKGQVTLWIFNELVATSCAEICVALGLLTLAVVALHVLPR